MWKRLIAKLRKKFQVGYEFKHYIDTDLHYPKDTSAPNIPIRYPELQYKTNKNNRHNIKKTLLKGEEEARIFTNEADVLNYETPYHVPHYRWNIDPRYYKKTINTYKKYGYFHMGSTSTNHNGLYKEYKQVYEIYNLPQHDYMKPDQNFFGNEYDNDNTNQNPDGPQKGTKIYFKHE